MSACATSTGTMAGSNNIGPAPDDGVRSLSAAERDSLLAESVADKQGPDVDVRAEVEWVGNSQTVRARFNLHDDAYVMVGQIDADGVVHVIFPTDPKDDGFARGDHAYTTPEVFAGFADQYRYRYSYTRYENGGYSPYSYDGSIGFMFVIASWRPMHFEQLSTNGEWDTYELASDDYLRDPRPAVYELASLLAGDNREAYTVKFAQYFNTEMIGGYGNTVSSLLFDNAFCSGFGAPIGYYSSPFYNPIFASLNYGSNFFYRGGYYQYSTLGDCYTTGIGNYLNPYANGYGYYGFGYSPFGQPPVAPRPGLFSAIGHRSPFTPHPTHMPQIIADGGGSPAHTAGHRAVADAPHFNPEYRNRGLITNDDPSFGSTRATPGADFHHDRVFTKPSIQDMVGRHMGDDNNGLRGFSHERIGNGDNGTMRQNWSHAENGSSNAGQGYRAPSSSWDGGRSQPRSSWDGGSQGRVNAPPQRSEPHYSAPASQPHFSAPAAAPAVHSAPAPAPAASPSKPEHH